MTNRSAPECNCRTARNETCEFDLTPRCCMKQRFWLLLHNKYFSDVCFIVGRERQRIDAHKAVLSASSCVFETMFNRHWSTKSKDVEVPDIEPATFSSLIRFLYTDEVQLTLDSAVKILYAAKKYAIDSLEDRCSEFLEKQLCPENACSLLMQARLFDQWNLIESCLGVIDETPEEVMTSDSFLQIDLAALRSILERDTLKVAEVDLFDAVVRWSVAECQRKNLAVNADNQRLVLEDAVSLVRFPLMSQNEFSSSILPFNLLSKDEALNLFRYFSGTPNALPKFNGTPRSSKEPLFVRRFKGIATWAAWSCDNQIDGIGFSFDHGVRLLGFGLYASDSAQETESKGSIMVMNQETGDTLYQASISYKRKFRSKEFIHRFLLKKPIKLTANTTYAVVSKINGPNIFGEGGQKCFEHKNVRSGKKITITFKTINFQGAAVRTTVGAGQFPEILFNW